MIARSVYVFIGIALLMTLAGGTLGYVVIEGWGFLDALYMVVLTGTTIGYGEVHDLTTAGRVFTIVLMLISWAFGAVMVGLITYTLVGIRFDTLFRRRQMDKRIKHMEDHYIVCGAGKVGRKIMLELLETKVPFVVIEHNRELAEELMLEHPELHIIEGDAADNEVLERANIMEARGLMCALDTDASNLFLCLTARDLNPGLRIVSRANEEDSVHKLEKAGADSVVSPVRIGALRMASSMIRPEVVSFLDVMIHQKDLTLRMEQVNVPAGSSMIGKTLIDAEIPQRTGLMVIAVHQKSTDKFIFNPGGAYDIEEGDAFVILGTPEQRQKLESLAKS
jgi:voltage-gated potassium channel